MRRYQLHSKPFFQHHFLFLKLFENTDISVQQHFVTVYPSQRLMLEASTNNRGTTISRSFMKFNKKWAQRLSLLSAAVLITIGLQACGGGGGGSTTAPTTGPAVGNNGSGGSNGGNGTTNLTLTDAQAQDMALKLWRNDDLRQHPKGSCAGCHGADFFDLARIGSTETDIIRRATLDGATSEQAQALAQAVRKMRTDFSLPATSARQFRPFQPGGAVLLPNLTDEPQTANIKRDVVFAQQLQTLLPTLYGPRITTLAQAQQAQAELLDLASGTNTAGANPGLLNLRKLPTGVQYPLWSADLHHGSAEGSFNDWIADIAHDAKPDRKAQWHALQDAYLKDPSNDNFWRMYVAAREMTQLPLMGNCSFPGAVINPALKCEATDDFNKHKFLSALKGQHMLRLEARGQLDSLFQGAIAFAYLDKAPYDYMKSREGWPLLPANMWEIGDRGRVMLESSNQAGSFKGNLASLGYPEFAQNSIDPLRSADTEQTALRKAWFWIGFTLDPSFARIHGSNATKTGEYMVGTLVQERMFNHMHFSALMRLITKGNLQDANMKRVNNVSTVQPDAVRFMANYSYSTAYNRTVASRLWNESRNLKFDAALKAQSEALFAQLAGNGFRMSLLLQTEALDSGKLSATDKTQLIDIMSNKPNPNSNNGSIIYGLAYNMHEHFEEYHSATQTQDEAMIKALLTKLGITASQGF
jgi:hypothetical protein